MRGGRLTAFCLSAFTGLLILMTAVTMWADFRSIWQDDDSFINSDYLIINHLASAGQPTPLFSAEEIEDISRQPWVRDTGAFTPADFRVDATLETPGGSFSSLLFFESVPDRFLDIDPSVWRYTPSAASSAAESDGSDLPEVPVILSKSYLTLYNFGFARGNGMPQLTEQLMAGIPLRLTLTSNDGSRRIVRRARIAGLSNRLNTILVPETFIKESNMLLGSGHEPAPGRLIINVSRPGDSAIEEYLESHDLEAGQPGGNAQATFMLRIAAVTVGAIGVLIALLSTVILTLSLSLLMERSRERIARLRMLGYTSRRIGRPFRTACLTATGLSWVAAGIGLTVIQSLYTKPLQSLGGEASGLLAGLLTGLAAAIIIFAAGLLTVRRNVNRAPV